MISSFRSKDPSEFNAGNENSQRWEDIVLAEEDESSDTQSCDAKECQSDSAVKNIAHNLLKESAHLVLEATPDFIANASIASMFSLLSFLVLQKNGLTADQLESFFSLSCIWLSSMLGGYLIRCCQLPPLLGMIIASVIVTNSSENIRIPESWGETITSSGLAIILLLSGLELDLKGLQKSSGIAARLTCVPGVVEATISGLMAMLVFGMPFWLGLSLGFILAAVSPALVVVGMLNLQRLGYGVKKGIPSLVVAAASFDDIVAIAGFSFFIGLAIQSEHSSVLYSVLHGPLSVIIGVSAGVTSGLILSMTKIWNTAWKRTVVATLLVLCLMFGMKKLSFAGAGAMGSLITGIVASHNWQNAVPTIISVEANDKFAQTTESHISVLWSIIFEPLLFGFIGSALDFDLLQGSVSKSLGILTVGILFRLLAAYFATGGEPNVLTDKERAFIALVWVPKATVQAALCSFPLMLAKDMIPLDSKDYEQYMIWGNEILSTAILSIVVTAPLGLIVIQYLGPRWLTKDKPEECDGIMGNKNKQDKDTNKDKDKIICHVSRMDDLIQKISLSSSQVETSCILAEMRQLNWKCKSVLNIIPKKDNA